MEYRIITDTVLPPKHSTALFERMIPVFPRNTAMRTACPGKAEFSSVCAYDTPTFVLTAPAQLSGTYASARDALSRVQNAIVIDSKTFGAGQLLLADLTAKTADCESFRLRFQSRYARFEHASFVCSLRLTDRHMRCADNPVTDH